MATLTRFDIPETVKAMITKAVEIDIIDVIGMYCLATKHQDNWLELANELTEIAFADVHSGNGKHSEIVKAAEKVWTSIVAPLEA